VYTYADIYFRIIWLGIQNYEMTGGAMIFHLLCDACCGNKKCERETAGAVGMENTMWGFGKSDGDWGLGMLCLLALLFRHRHRHRPLTMMEED